MSKVISNTLQVFPFRTSEKSNYISFKPIDLVQVLLKQVDWNDVDYYIEFPINPTEIQSLVFQNLFVPNQQLLTLKDRIQHWRNKLFKELVKSNADLRKESPVSVSNLDLLQFLVLAINSVGVQFKTCFPISSNDVESSIHTFLAVESTKLMDSRLFLLFYLVLIEELIPPKPVSVLIPGVDNNILKALIYTLRRKVWSIYLAENIFPRQLEIMLDNFEEKVLNKTQELAKKQKSSYYKHIVINTPNDPQSDTFGERGLTDFLKLLKNDRRERLLRDYSQYYFNQKKNSRVISPQTITDLRSLFNDSFGKTIDNWYKSQESQKK